MAGRRELGLPRPTASSLREQAARTTLRKVRLQGHTYVELREEGKRFIFFCTLCRAPCYNDSTLFDHLRGNLHRERYEAAKVTLLGSNPWPFNDGVLFFHDSPEQDKPLAISSSSQKRLLISNNNHDDNDHNNNGLALVNHGGISNCLPNGPLMLDGVDHRKQTVSCGVESRCILNINDKNLDANGGNQTMIIREVVIKDEISDLQVKLMGFGQISARICENEISKRISRIWCAWLGKQDPGDRDMLSIPDYEFGVVIFSSTFDLGRKGLLDDLSPLLSSSPHTEIENVTGTRKKRRKSFSDPEDISESLSDCGSSGEDFGDSYSSMSRLLLDRYDDQLQHTRLISSKNFRRELRRQQRVAAERMCDVCQHKMLPGKDVRQEDLLAAVEI
uniref:C2H2-type domain-containing protein n=1 Tax=Nelumbo nucifera TaxID=4432 RepID=A0A822XLP6_NELNU|nr:TPA_asm: hypothetical protein HUJ06_022385 [Nelumbo nucifera]